MEEHLEQTKVDIQAVIYDNSQEQVKIAIAEATEAIIARAKGESVPNMAEALSANSPQGARGQSI